MNADIRTYLSDQAWRQERDRLRALEVLFDRRPAAGGAG
jgi:hypothetical protein